MKIVIDMSEIEYNEIKENNCGLFDGRYFEMIRNGTPLPKEKKYHVYATSEAEVSIDSEDELEILNEAHDFLIANMDCKIVREVE